MKNKLVAMENAFFDAEPHYSWEQRCAAIAEAGFDGVYVVPWPLTEACFAGYLRDITSAPAANGLSMSTFFANIDFAVPSSSVRTRRVLEEVAGFKRLELSLKCSDPQQNPSDPIAAARKEIELLLPLAEARNLEICLYHHTFYPIYHPDQCVELINLIQHPLLCYAFATSHAYAHFKDEEILQILTRHAPHIKSFNICGCKRPGPFGSTKTKQYPLYESDLPLEPLLKILADSNYSGDIVVQGHGWQGNITENLRRSKAWYTDCV
jgi:sugar phosphate isomerase/epimerase